MMSAAPSRPNALPYKHRQSAANVEFKMAANGFSKAHVGAVRLYTRELQRKGSGAQKTMLPYCCPFGIRSRVPSDPVKSYQCVGRALHVGFSETTSPSPKLSRSP